MRRRNAFTIVELLVAMALIIFIMAILSNAFVAATTTFRNLKAIGDLANNLRSVTTLLQHDLSADHFDGKKRLSNPNFWVNGPPSQGYFRIWQGSAGALEGTDVDGIGSYRSVDHMLAFTVKLRGDQMGDFMTAGGQGGATVLGSIPQFGPMEARYQVAGAMYSYQWAEVAWFLQPQIDPNTGIQDTTVGGIPLYTLYRNQRLAVPDNNLVTQYYTTTTAGASLGVANAQAINCLGLSCWPNAASGYLYFNSPIDLTVPSRRFGMVPTAPAGLPYATIAYPPTPWPLLTAPTGTWSLPNLSFSPTYPPPMTPSYPTLAQQGAAGTLAGADIQATDVLSFDVRLLVGTLTSSGTVVPVAPLSGTIDPFVTLWQAPFNTLNTAGGINNGNPAFYNPTTNLTGPMVFDTWTSLNDGLSNYLQWNVTSTAVTPNLAAIPLWNPTTLSGPIIQAIQITIRLWDMKTQQTREVTIVQAM